MNIDVKAVTGESGCVYRITACDTNHNHELRKEEYVHRNRTLDAQEIDQVS